MSPLLGIIVVMVLFICLRGLAESASNLIIPPPPKPKASASQRAPSTATAPEDFTVTSIKTVKIKVPKDIELVNPPHRCTMTSGVVDFEWQFRKEFKRQKLQLLLEEIEKKQKFTLNAKRTRRRHFMGPGLYRWRVVDLKNKVESRWRVFRIVDLDAGRGISSVGQKLIPYRTSMFVKMSPDLPDYDADDTLLPKVEDHVTAPKPPLKRK